VYDEESEPFGDLGHAAFGLIEALLGRRSRRFFLGAEIPDGVFAYKSGHAPVPLSELEKLLVVAACGSNTGWHHLIYRAERYAPYLSNYAGAAGGRTFPSAAGFHTSMTFFTDDQGVYVLTARDAPAFAERQEDGSIELEALLGPLRSRVRKLQDGRLGLPPEVPYTGPQHQVVNHPGTLLVIQWNITRSVEPIYMLQNDLWSRMISAGGPSGIETFKDLVDVNNVALAFVEQWSMAKSLGTFHELLAGSLMLHRSGGMDVQRTGSL
jgi:hypothetical protein